MNPFLFYKRLDISMYLHKIIKNIWLNHGVYIYFFLMSSLMILLSSFIGFFCIKTGIKEYKFFVFFFVSFLLSPFFVRIIKKIKKDINFLHWLFFWLLLIIMNFFLYKKVINYLEFFLMKFKS